MVEQLHSDQYGPYAPQHSNNERIPKICLLGKTGAGKSTFCNNIILQPEVGK